MIPTISMILAELVRSGIMALPEKSYIEGYIVHHTSYTHHLPQFGQFSTTIFHSWPCLYSFCPAYIPTYQELFNSWYRWVMYDSHYIVRELFRSPPGNGNAHPRKRFLHIHGPQRARNFALLPELPPPRLRRTPSIHAKNILYKLLRDSTVYVQQILRRIVVSIPACHAGDPGSISVVFINEITSESPGGEASFLPRWEVLGLVRVMAMVRVRV